MFTDVNSMKYSKHDNDRLSQFEKRKIRFTSENERFFVNIFFICISVQINYSLVARDKFPNRLLYKIR